MIRSAGVVTGDLQRVRVARASRGFGGGTLRQLASAAATTPQWDAAVLLPGGWAVGVLGHPDPHRGLAHAPGDDPRIPFRCSSG